MKFLVLAALLAGAAIALGYVVLARRGRDPLGPRPAGEIPDTGLALVAGVLAWLLGQALVPALTEGTDLGRLGGRTGTVLVVTAIHFVVSLALLRAALGGTVRAHLSAGRLVLAGALAAVVVIATQVVCGIVIDFVYERLGAELPVQAIVDESRDATGLDLVVRVAAALALAPFAEEVFFRGILLPAAARVAGPARGLLFQAAVFGLIHCVSQWEAWPLAIPLAIVGWVAGWLYLRTGSLAAPIVLHAAFNAFNFAALRMSEPPPPR